MTTKPNVKVANVTQMKSVSSEAKKLRPAPISLRVRTTVKAGLNFTKICC